MAHNLIYFQVNAEAKAEAVKLTKCLTNFGGINYVTSI